MLKVYANGKQIVIYIADQTEYAIDRIYIREGGPLDEGDLNGYDLQSTWHYGVFDVQDGNISDASVCTTNLNQSVKVDKINGDILINPDGAKI